MINWKHRFAISILFVIVQMLVSDNTEMTSQTRSLAYAWKTEQPKAGDPEAAPAGVAVN